MLYCVCACVCAKNFSSTGLSGKVGCESDFGEMSSGFESRHELLVFTQKSGVAKKRGLRNDGVAKRLGCEMSGLRSVEVAK